LKNLLSLESPLEKLKQLLRRARPGLCEAVKDARAVAPVRHQPTILEIG
jgi:hypothetical protein